MSEFEKYRYQKLLEFLKSQGILCYIGILNDGQDEYIVLKDPSQAEKAKTLAESKGIACHIKPHGLSGSTVSLWFERETVPEDCQDIPEEPAPKKKRK